MSTFAVIDFETATAAPNSACAVGIINYHQGIIIDEYYTLIKPPKNEYLWQNTRMHGISEKNTRNALSFLELYETIKSRLYHRVVVAHNESFDRNVMLHTMEHYAIDYYDLELPEKWECTVKLYRNKGYLRCNLKSLSQHFQIPLVHHDALSDAKACGQLFLNHLMNLS